MADDVNLQLSEAVISGDISEVRRLLEEGADPNKSDALYGAAISGHTDTVQILLDRGADVNQSCALPGAAWKGHKDIIKILLDRGADINKSYPLIRAASEGHRDTVRLLLDNGADWNQLDVLRDAIESGQPDTFDKMVYWDLNQERIAKIKEELSKSSKSDVQDPLPEQTWKEQLEQQEQFTAGLGESVETPCNINIAVVGHKGVGKSCFIKQIRQEYIPEGGPQSTDIADSYGSYLAYNPNTGYRKKLDENGEEETHRRRLKRIIDLYQKFETTGKEPSPLPSELSTQPSASSTTTKLLGVQRKRKSHKHPSRSKYAKLMNLSSEQRNIIKEIMQTKTDEGDEQMTGFIKIFEVGGDKVFHNTHRCFMSSNMVFVLVFDVAMCLDPVRSKDGYESIETWLKYIATYAIEQEACGERTPPVILVGSHLDVVSQNKQKQEEAFGAVLGKLYENPQLSKIMENHVQEMYAIAHLNESGKNQDLYEEVWKKMTEIAPLQSRWKKPEPARWLALEHQLVKQKNAGGVILTFEELLEMNNKSAIPLTEHELMDCLRYLTFAGCFLCFDFQSKRPFVVLRPQLIINAFKAIITVPQFTDGLSTKLKLMWTKYESTGVLTLDLIRQLWERNDDKSFLANTKTLLVIMETLYLFVNPLQNNSNDEVDYFIVPSMLRTADPEIIQPVLDDPQTVTTVTLCLKFDNPFISQAVWDKMIATCIHRFPRLNERGHDGSKFIQRGFVCLSVDFLWNVIINCSENVMKITMFKKDTDKSVPAGAGVDLRSILEIYINEILELHHQSHLKYQFYLHNDYSFSSDDKMVKVDDIRRTLHLQCHSSTQSRWLDREDIEVWFKIPGQNRKQTNDDRKQDLPDRNLSVKEMGRISRYIGISYQTFFIELGCPFVVLEQKMAENRGFSFRSLITKIFIHLLKIGADVAFPSVADAMSGHGLDPETLYSILDDNRETLFDDDTLSETRLQECLTVNDVPVIAVHVNAKDYFNLFLELGFLPERVDEFCVNFRNYSILNLITAMVEEFIDKTKPCPTLNTVLLAMIECDMDTNSLIKALTQTKIAKIKDESSKSDVQDPLPEQTRKVKKEQMEQQQKQFTAGIAESVETPCNITITVVGHKGVGKSCFVKQIKQENIPEGRPDSTDTADVYVNYLAFNPETRFRKKLDENGEIEFSRERLKRIIDLYRKREKTDKESCSSTPGLPEQNDQKQTELLTKQENMAVSTSSRETPSPLPSVTSSASSSSTKTEVQLKRTSHANPSPSEGIKHVKLSSEQISLIEEIMHTETEGKDEQMKGFITIYDFGGEKVFYNTHHCLMSSNMVYILVFDVSMCLDPVRSKDGYERIENWLRSIATFAIDEESRGKETPPVIMVGSFLDVVSRNKKEQEEAFGAVMNKLCANPQLEEIMKTHVHEMYPIAHLNDSGKNEEKYELMWEKIIEIARFQSQWEKPVPARYLALEHLLVKRKNEGDIILTYEELFDINKKSPVPLPKNDIQDFLRYLRFAGTFLCFGLKSNRPVIVLRPQWLIDAFKAIITDPNFTFDLSVKLTVEWTLYQKSGKITIDFIRQLWGRHKDSDFLSKETMLCDVMESLGLLAKPFLDNSNDSNDKVEYFIVPSMLQTADPGIIQEVLDVPDTVTTVTLCLKFNNPFIPQAVWDKMIATCIHRFSRLNERGHDGSRFIQRGFVCLAVDVLWNMIVNCSENVMKITMFKNNTDKSVPTGTGVTLLSILEFHVKRILELNHQSHLKYQLYLHNDYRFTADDKMVKVDDLRRVSSLKCYSSNGSRWLGKEDLHIWFKCPDKKNSENETERKEKHARMIEELSGWIAPRLPHNWNIFQTRMECYLSDGDVYGTDVNCLNDICRALIRDGTIGYGKYDKLRSVAVEIHVEAAKVIDDASLEINDIKDE
ncbi:uncharacterized protein LOC117326235 [Pecten maximus]|uniref:uncharacterized protein LOC117326235 n=1 Tax=Pecten maximus TaxID=6579 RepID=UPI00145917C1|nr:uncharacterized protein LOC117326235 [Pecten maximus]